MARYRDGEFKPLDRNHWNIAHGMEDGSERLTQKLHLAADLGGQPDAIGLCFALVPLFDIPTLNLMDRGGQNTFIHGTWRKGSVGAARVKSMARPCPSPGRYGSTSVTHPDHRQDLQSAWFYAHWHRVFAGKFVIFVGPTVLHNYKGG
jgi:hypothetical protein